VTKKGSWHSQDACNCHNGPCSNNQVCVPTEWAWSRTTQTCWSVTGGVSAAGKTSLLLRLFGELSVSVNFGTTWTSCTSLTSGLTFSAPISDCFKTAVRDVWEEQAVSGTDTYAETVAYWSCQDDAGFTVEFTTECGRYTVSGTADNVSSRTTQIAQLPAECGGNPPPEHDGKTQEKCCSPIAGCDPPPPPPGLYCCPCIAPD
jgi:hypothetical protein